MNKKSHLSAFLSLLLLFTLLLTLLTVPAHTALSWSVQTVDENGASLYSHASIVVDSNNTQHIAYNDLTNGTYFVMYASYNGSGWNTQTVAVGIDAYSLVLDANGNPHITRYVETGERFVSHVLYATANVTEPAEVSPTFPALPLLLASTAAIIGAIIIIVYFKKRKDGRNS